MSQELSAAEMGVLVDGLHAVLVLVAAADGAIDAKEKRRFQQMLEAAKTTDLPILRSVVEAALRSDAASAEQNLGAPDAGQNALRAAAQLADAKLDDDTAQRFKQGLYAVGKQLAQASGGGLLGIGRRTSQEEQAALQTLAKLLGLAAS